MVLLSSNCLIFVIARRLYFRFCHFSHRFYHSWYFSTFLCHFNHFFACIQLMNPIRVYYKTPHINSYCAHFMYVVKRKQVKDEQHIFAQIDKSNRKKINVIREKKKCYMLFRCSFICIYPKCSKWIEIFLWEQWHVNILWNGSDNNEMQTNVCRCWILIYLLIKKETNLPPI